MYERIIESLSLYIYSFISTREKKYSFVFSSEIKTKFSSLQRYNSTTLSAHFLFLYSPYTRYEEKEIWEKRVSSTFVDSIASESVSRAKVHIVSGRRSLSFKRKREREGERRNNRREPRKKSERTGEEVEEVTRRE